MDGTWAPISSPGGVLPSDRAVHRSESDTNRKHKGNLFRQAMNKKGREEEGREVADEGMEAAPAAEQARSSSTLDEGEHRVDFLA